MKPEDSQPHQTVTASGSPLEVCYASPPGSRFRNRIYFLTHSLDGFLIGAMALAGILVLAGLWDEKRAVPMCIAMVGGLAGPFIMRWIASNGQPVPTLLPWKSTFDALGFTDETTERKNSIPWRTIKEVRFHAGDIYVLTWRGVRSCVPREAFGSGAVAREFCDRVQSLRERQREGAV